jgi:phospholipid transport system substrate-binding protein
MERHEAKMKRNRIGMGKLAAIFAMAMLTAGAAGADAPDPAAQQVQGFYDVLLDAMKHAKELGVKGRGEKLKPAIEKSFDLAGMIRAAVGSKWASLKPEEQQGLLRAFERKTVAEYASNFDGFDGEKFIVEPKVAVRGADKVVQSKLVTASQTVTFGYRMRQTDGAWKVLDIYLNGVISQLAMQRSDFAATLQSGGAAALEKMLNAKADKLMGG